MWINNYCTKSVATWVINLLRPPQSQTQLLGKTYNCLTIPWNYILELSFKLMLLLAIWSWKYNNGLKRKIGSLQTSITQVCRLVLYVFPRWISKTWIRKHKNHSTTSKDAGRFAHVLRAYKNS